VYIYRYIYTNERKEDDDDVFYLSLKIYLFLQKPHARTWLLSNSIYPEFKEDFKRRICADRFKICSSPHHQLAEGDTSAFSEQSMNLSDMTNLTNISEGGTSTSNSKGSNPRFQNWLEAAKFYM
jgi:hypothetical protein